MIRAGASCAGAPIDIVNACVKHANETYKHNKGGAVENIRVDGEYVDFDVIFDHDLPGFDRQRRITGYLVTSLSRWNDAKFAELNDRVKHIGV